MATAHVLNVTTAHHAVSASSVTVLAATPAPPAAKADTKLVVTFKKSYARGAKVKGSIKVKESAAGSATGKVVVKRGTKVVGKGTLKNGKVVLTITKPLEVAGCPVRFTAVSVSGIAKEAGGYPYFIQFICREVFDVVLQQPDPSHPQPIPIEAIQRKRGVFWGLR